MATCNKCGTIMAATPGAKCPACGAVSNPRPEPAPREMQPVVEDRPAAPASPGSPPEALTPEDVARQLSAKVDEIAAIAGERPKPGGIQMTALGFNLILYGVAVYIASLVAAAWSPGLGTAVGTVAFLLVVGGVILVGMGLGFTLIPIAVAVLFMFIPLVNVVILLVVCARAVRALKAAGWRIGFMGAKRPVS